MKQYGVTKFLAVEEVYLSKREEDEHTYKRERIDIERCRSRARLKKYEGRRDLKASENVHARRCVRLKERVVGWLMTEEDAKRKRTLRKE